MGDTIYRQAAIDALDGEIIVTGSENAEAVLGYANLVLDRIKRLPSAQPGEWLENYVSAILQAGSEGREVSFRVGDRTFAVRELNDER